MFHSEISEFALQSIEGFSLLDCSEILRTTNLKLLSFLFSIKTKQSKGQVDFS